MHSISVAVLLSAASWAHARNPIDQLGERMASSVLSMLGTPQGDSPLHQSGENPLHRSGEAMADKVTNKLGDRAFVVWSPNHGLLDDTIYAKPGANPVKNPEPVTVPTSPSKGKSVPTSPSKGGFSLRMPNLLAPLYAPFRMFWPSKEAPAARAEQANLPVLQIPVSPSKSPSKAKPWAEEGGNVVNLAPIPEFAPDDVTSEDAAKISIAGSTPRIDDASTPREEAASQKLQDGDLRIIQDGAPIGNLQAEERLHDIASERHTESSSHENVGELQAQESPQGTLQDEAAESASSAEYEAAKAEGKIEAKGAEGETTEEQTYLSNTKRVGDIQGQEPPAKFPKVDVSDTGGYTSNPDHVGDLSVEELVKAQEKLQESQYNAANQEQAGDLKVNDAAERLRKEIASTQEALTSIRSGDHPKFSANASEFVPGAMKYTPMRPFQFDPFAPEYVPAAMKSWPKSFAQAAKLPHIGAGILSSQSDLSPATRQRFDRVRAGMRPKSSGGAHEVTLPKSHHVNHESIGKGASRPKSSDGAQGAIDPKLLIVNPESITKGGAKPLSWADIVKNAASNSPANSPVPDHQGRNAGSVDAIRSESSGNTPKVVTSKFPVPDATRHREHIFDAMRSGSKSRAGAPNDTPPKLPVAHPRSNILHVILSASEPKSFADAAKKMASNLPVPHHGEDTRSKSSTKVTPFTSGVPQHRASLVSAIKSTDDPKAAPKNHPVFDVGHDVMPSASAAPQHGASILGVSKSVDDSEFVPPKHRVLELGDGIVNVVARKPLVIPSRVAPRAFLAQRFPVSTSFSILAVVLSGFFGGSAVMYMVLQWRRSI